MKDEGGGARGRTQLESEERGERSTKQPESEEQGARSLIKALNVIIFSSAPFASSAVNVPLFFFNSLFAFFAFSYGEFLFFFS
jgi:hypothetical protein